MFAMGYKQTMSKARSYETFARSLEVRFEQIESKLATDHPNVVFFPEDTALTAWLIGPRGEQARKESNSAVSAVASLAVTYAPQVAYYESKCQVPPARALVLALTDTTWRAFGETLSRLAKEYGTHVIASANIGEVTRVTEPARVALLGDPDLPTDYAYEAKCDKAYNQAFFFRPRGRMFHDDGELMVREKGAQLAGVVPKAYLVPIERDQTGGLALSSANPSFVRPVDLGFASFGVFTSKDAWMSDLPNRNDVDDTDVFLQPEAGAWAGWSESGQRDWQQDAMHRALWGFVQKLPNTRWGALSNLIGNFHDLPFDGTPTITTDAPDFRVEGKGRPNRRHFLLGRKLTDGIVARSRWFAPDPPKGVPFRAIKKRRAFLQSEGAKRAPGGSKENEYLDRPFVWADVTLPGDRSVGRRVVRPRGVARSAAISRTGLAQWEPALTTAPNGRVVAAWTDLRTGDEDALVSKLTASGWSEPVNAGPDTRNPDDQEDNQYGVDVAAAAGEVHAVWVDFRNQAWTVRGSSARLGSLEFADDERVDHARSASEGYPHETLHNDPAVGVTRKGETIALWDDLRARHVDRDIRSATKKDASAWKGDAKPSRRDAVEDFHPSVDIDGRGRAWVVWQRHGRGDADIRMTRSRGGSLARFHPHIRVDDGPRNADAFHPQIALSGGKPLIAWSDDRSGRYQIRATVMLKRGVLSSIRVARNGADQLHPEVVAIGKRRWAVAWTDQRAGDQDVLVRALRFSNGRLRRSRLVRVDDSIDADARMPALAYSHKRIYVAWEDTRRGPEEIRTSSLRKRLLSRARRRP